MKNKEWLKEIINIALAKVDKFENISKHKSLFGNKEKYVNAIVRELQCNDCDYYMLGMNNCKGMCLDCVDNSNFRERI